MKRNLVLSLTLFGAAGLLASCAGDSTPTLARSTAGGQCFHPVDVVSFNKLSVTRFALHTQRGDDFTADLPVCQGIDFAMQVAIQPVSNTQVCDGDVARLITRDPGGHDLSCPAYNFHHLSAAEVAALPQAAQR